MESVPTDSLSQVIEEEEMPLAADELFDDFFFNYAANRKVQRERTSFPLPMNNMGQESVITKEKWKHERFFMKQGYYISIFNNAKQANLMKDTAVNEVVVEKIAVQKGTVTQWHFARKRGLWAMDSIKVVSMKKHRDASFLRFYHRFTTDSAFQATALADPITFTGPDPDDDFSTMTGEITPEQWPYFAPWIPVGVYYNIVYSPQNMTSSNVRFMYIRGISNGLQTDLIFTRAGKSWRLKKVTT